MAVSKHNLWKRKKNGVMKLVRSHSDWLARRFATKIRTKYIKSAVRTATTSSGRTAPVVSNKSVASSAKRTQVGKKI